MLAKCFSDVAKKSGYAFSGTQFRWVLGPGYTWHDFFIRNKGKNVLKVSFDSPPTAYIFMWMLINCVFYGVIAWYLDNIFPSNRGKDVSKTFFLKASYWCPRRNQVKAVKNESDLTSPYLPPIDTDEASAQYEAKRVESNLQNDYKCNGLRVFSISKFFKTSTTPKLDFEDEDGPYSRPGYFRALSKICFEVE